MKNKVIVSIIEADEEGFKKIIKKITRDELIAAVNDEGLDIGKITVDDTKLTIAERVVIATADNTGKTTPEEEKTDEEVEAEMETEAAVLAEQQAKDKAKYLEEMTAENLNPNEDVNVRQLELLGEKYNQVPVYINPYMSAIRIPQLGVIAICNGAPVFISSATIISNSSGNLIGRQ